jgi:hypothetical protein
MIGGKIIEVKRDVLPDGRDAMRLWCVDTTYGDELAVWTPVADDLPALGDSIWWQAGKIYWSSPQRGFHDRPLPKIANSHDPRSSP